MISVLTITTAAQDRRLLTVEEMRAAVNITGNDSDASLTLLEAKIAASVTSECNVAVGSGGEPTLRRESLTQTIYQAHGEYLVLARRHDVAIVSVVEDGVTLAATDYLVESEAGLLWRMQDDRPGWWTADKVVISYNAGFTDVPADLKQAASDFARFAFNESKRDPALKSERIDVPQVLETERQYWVGSVPGQSNEGAVPDVVSGQLRRFRNSGVA